MPYEIVRKKSGKFQVVNNITGEIHAKGTTLKKAKAQVRLLDNLEGGDRGRTPLPIDPTIDIEAHTAHNMDLQGRFDNFQDQIEILLNLLGSSPVIRFESQFNNYLNRLLDEVQDPELHDAVLETTGRMIRDPRYRTWYNRIYVDPRSGRGSDRMVGGIDPELRLARRDVSRLYADVFENLFNEEEYPRLKAEYVVMRDRWGEFVDDRDFESVIDELEQIKNALGFQEAIAVPQGGGSGASTPFDRMTRGELADQIRSRYRQLEELPQGSPEYDIVFFILNSLIRLHRQRGRPTEIITPEADDEDYEREQMGKEDKKGGSYIQPINHKPDYNYCCGGALVHPINPKFLPFF